MKIFRYDYLQKYNALFAFLLFFGVFIYQSTAEDFFDSKGKDHWLTFPPNFHNNITNTRPEFKYGDSLYIFITCEIPTKGQIDYFDIDANSYTEYFEITDPSQIYTFKTTWFDFELQGYNRSGVVWRRHQCEEIAPQSFHVTSEEDVMVYGHSQSVMTSDAFLVLPTDVLGMNYYVLAYKSDISYGGLSNTPSQFAIVATEDNTEINIFPMAFTYVNGYDYQNIILNKGDVYLVQANASNSSNNNDLTGSKIISDKPIAVFAGHQRTPIPSGELSGTPSRDFLIEQMPPVKNWGKNAFIVPFQQENNQSSQGDDIYRVLAAYDDTEVTIDDSEKIFLDETEFFEKPITNPSKIKANKPILVAQYKKTAGSGGGSNQGTGDPMMMLIPPKEQFMLNYRVINAQAYEAYTTMNGTIDYRAVYNKQYINVICPTDRINSVKIDGNSVNPASFKVIPTSDYSYAAFKVTDGVHAVEADAPFGIYIYGYGPANSYGYIGGMSFKPYDFLPPEISYISDCFKVSGALTDSTMNDTGIIDAYVPVNSIENVVVNLAPFNLYQKVIPFEAELINWRLDGKFSLIVKDSMEFITSLDMGIPGFTVAVEGVKASDQIPEHSADLRESVQYCFDVILENYGNFEQRVLDIVFENSEITSDFSGPIYIQPGIKKTIQVCFVSDVTGEFTDSLVVIGDCMERKAMDLSFIVRKDDIDPKLHRTSDPCNTTINLIITDSTSFDYGLESITFPEKFNCDIQNIEQSIELYKFEVKVIDVYQDAYYTIVVSDIGGNTISFYDTIPGFTLTISNPETDTNFVDYGDMIIGSMLCKSIAINNYGEFPKTIDNLYLVYKMDYSIPESQFPKTLESGETVFFDICFHPTEVIDGFITDTVKILFNCAERNIPLLGVAEPKINEGISRCDVSLRLFTRKVPRSYFLEIYPNPMIETGVIRAGIPAKDNYRIYISNIYGNVVKEINNIELTGGIYEFEFQTGDLPAGSYICTVQSPMNRVSRTLVIIK